MMDRWTFFIKNAENLNVIPSDVTDEGLKTAYVEVDKHNWSKVEMDAYFDAGAMAADNLEERIKSEEIGVKKGKLEAARNLKEMGFSVGDIVKATGLSVK